MPHDYIWPASVMQSSKMTLEPREKLAEQECPSTIRLGFASRLSLPYIYESLASPRARKGNCHPALQGIRISKMASDRTAELAEQECPSTILGLASHFLMNA